MFLNLGEINDIIEQSIDVLKEALSNMVSSQTKKKNDGSENVDQKPSAAEHDTFSIGNVGLATKPDKDKKQNEDFINKFKGELISAVAIADGVGSSVDAHIASEKAVTTFLKEVESFELKQKDLKYQDVVKFWECAADEIKKYFEDNKDKYKDKKDVLLTTLLTIIELKDQYLISYLGNGSIWFIRGNFWELWDTARPIPWCMSDLMIGHTSLDTSGGTPLYGFIGPKGDISNVSFLIIPKNTYCGELFIMTTDGISTPEDLKTARDPNKKLWIEINPHIENLVNISLKEWFKNISKEVSDENQSLTEILNKFVNERKFDDDATVGLIVSNKTKEYYLQNYKTQKNKS